MYDIASYFFPEIKIYLQILYPAAWNACKKLINYPAAKKFKNINLLDKHRNFEGTQKKFPCTFMSL